MALDLSSIAFKVETKELDDAVSKLGDLQKAVSNLNKPLNAGSMASEEFAQAQAKTAKANSDAASAAAKAELAQLRLGKATSSSGRSVGSNTSVLERQQKILEYMTQGFSKGQSSILAYAEAAGILDSEMKQLRGTLESQRKLLGSEPFDKSLGAIKVMKNELGALRESQRQYNSGVELTVKQAKDLYREKFRLIEAMKIERDRARELGDTTVSESQRYAKLKQDLRAINTEYVALSKQRNRLADDASSQEMTRKVNNLSRGLAPQISDVAVSLYGGMSPMTVLMQQGLQVRDLIQSSGVEAGKLNEVLKKTGADFIGTIGGTFKAIGGLAIGFFQSAGAGVVDFAMKVTGADARLKAFAKTSDEAAAGVAKFSGIVSTAVGATIAATIVTLIALAVAMKQVIQEESALTKAINVTGLSMGLSKDAAAEYAKSFEVIGISQSKAIGVITEMAKQGGFTKEAIQSVTKAAIDLEKYAGVSIETTVNNFAKFQDKPYEALLKVASATGLVTQAQLENIKSLENQGKQAEATAESIRIYGEVTQAQADLSKLSLSSIETLWIDVKSSISGAWEEIKNLARGEAFVNLLSDAFKVVRTVVSTVWYSIKQLNTALGAAAAIAGAMLSGNMSGAIEAGKQFISGWKEAANNQQGYLDNLWKAADAQTNVSTGLRLTAQQLEKNIVQAKDRAEWEKVTGDLVDKKVKREEGAIRIRNLGLSLGKSELEIQKNIAAWNEKNKDPKTKKDPIESSYDKAIKTFTNDANAATAAQEKYTKAQQDFLNVATSPEWNSYSDKQKQNIVAAAEEAIAREKVVEQNKEQLKAQLELQKVWDKTVKAQTDLDNKDFDSIAKSDARLALLDEELADLILQKSIYGDLSVEQKKQIEYAKIKRDLTKEIADIELRVSKGDLSTDAAKILKENEYIAAAKKRQNIDQAIILENNKYEYEQRVQLAAGISSSIEAALFEGGQAGSKKLREVIEAELRKPITLFIQAFVQDIFGLNSAGDTMSKAVSAFDKVLGFVNGGYASGLTKTGTSVVGSLVNNEVGANLGLSYYDGTKYTTTGLGDTLGTTAGQIGGGMTAYGLQKTLSGGYKTGESGLVDAATAIGGFFDPTGGLIAGTIGGGVNRAFGRKLTETGIEGTFGGSQGFTGNQYSFEKGGWFRSDRTKTSALDSGIQSGFAQQFNTLRAGIAVMSTSLGLGTKSIEDFTYSFKLNLMGLSEADATKKLSEEFNKVGVAIADTIPELSKYSKAGETNLDVLTRLATSLNTVNDVFKSLGFTLEEISLSGADSANEIIDAYGGKDSFTQVFGQYYSDFYSAEEKRANVLKDINTVLKEAGESTDAVNLTRESYRTLVEKLIETRGAADPAVVSLIRASSAFASITEDVDALNESTKKAAKEVEDLNNKRIASDRKLVIEARKAIEEKEKLAKEERLKVYNDGLENFNTLSESLLKAGDSAKLLALITDRAFSNPAGTYNAGGVDYQNPTWTEGMTAAQFNYSFGVMQALTRKDLSNSLSANALSVQNVKEAMRAVSVEQMMSPYNPVTGSAYIGIRDGIVEAVGDTGYVVRDAVDSLSLTLAKSQVRAAYTATGPGLANVFATMASAGSASASRNAGRFGTVYGEGVAAYGQALTNLEGAFYSGKITTEQFNRAVSEIDKAVPGAAEALNDLSSAIYDGEAAAIGAAHAVGKAGYDSIHFYFGELGKLVDSLDKAAEEAATPVSVLTSVMGRLNSANTAFGVSANAAMSLAGIGRQSLGNGLSYQQALPDIRKAMLIAEGAKLASDSLTTESATELQEALDITRESALLLEGVVAYDAKSLEDSFRRISNALVKNTINEEEYAKLFDKSIAIYTDYDNKIQEVTDSFKELTSAAQSLADKLLLDAGVSTLSKSQSLTEAQRQYNSVALRAMQGDVTASGELAGVTQSMLEIAKNQATTEQDYARIFGSTIGNLRTIESLQIPERIQQPITVANQSNEELIERIKSLEETIRIGNAQIANNTDKTNKTLTSYQVNGLPTVALE